MTLAAIGVLSHCVASPSQPSYHPNTCGIDRVQRVPPVLAPGHSETATRYPEIRGAISESNTLPLLMDCTPLCGIYWFSEMEIPPR